MLKSCASIGCAKTQVSRVSFHIQSNLTERPPPNKDPLPTKTAQNPPERNYSIFTLRIETPCQQRPETTFFLPKDHVSPVNKDHFQKYTFPSLFVDINFSA